MRCWPHAPRGFLFTSVLALASVTLCSGDTNTLDWQLKLPFESFSSPALASDGSIIIGCGQGVSESMGGLLSVSSTGQLNWRLPVGPVMASPLIAPDDTILVGSTLGSFYSISSTGQVNWSFKVTNSTTQASKSKLYSSAALGRDGTIFVTAVGQGLCALSLDGRLKWMFQMPAVPLVNMQISSPAIGPDGTIYVGSADKKVYAIWPNGTERWDYSTGDSISASPCIAEDGTVLIGSDDGKLHALTANGSQKWEFDAGRIIESSCAIGSDGTIYVGSLNNRFFALDQDGHPKWTNAVSNPVSASPILTRSGQIWVGAIDGSVSVFNPDGSRAGTNRFGTMLFSSPVISSGTAPYIYFASWNTLYYRALTNGLAASTWPMFRRDPAHLARADQCSLAVTGMKDAALQLTLLMETNRSFFLEQSENLTDWKASQELKPTATQLLIPMSPGTEKAFYRLRTGQ